jgi:multimeric flavodoxin WrbA
MGSPRRRGNSEQLLRACIEGLAGAGAVVDELVVVEHDIRPCRGCNACSSTGECVIRDEMQDVYPRIDAADAIVVATPVFFATVPAVLKALFDRLQPYWARRYVLGEDPPARRPGAILVARGGGDPYGSDAAVTTTKSVFGVLGIDCLGILDVEDVDVPADIGARPEVLQSATELGARLAEEARSSQDPGPAGGAVRG